jgi:hypothetical protein
MQTIRSQLIDDAIVNHGLTPVKAEQVVEGMIRAEQARVTGQPFHYKDVEESLEALYREAGANPNGFEKAKAKVWAAAREAHGQSGGDLNEHLFFCFHDSIAMHREYQAAQPFRRGRLSRKPGRSGVFLFDDPTDGDFFSLG